MIGAFAPRSGWLLKTIRLATEMQRSESSRHIDLPEIEALSKGD
ncbi:hypothetical protein [Paenibacillus alvei]|nr:hypothetical protein [Paenibacillus alvei]